MMVMMMNFMYLRGKKIRSVFTYTNYPNSLIKSNVSETRFEQKLGHFTLQSDV